MWTILRAVSATKSAKPWVTRKSAGSPPAQAVVDDDWFQFQDALGLVPRRPLEMETSDRTEGDASP